MPSELRVGIHQQVAHLRVVVQKLAHRVRLLEGIALLYKDSISGGLLRMVVMGSLLLPLAIVIEHPHFVAYRFRPAA